MLNEMGRYDEVWTAVEALRPQMEMPLPARNAHEAIDPWDVREFILCIGHTAALRTNRWGVALTINAELTKLKQARNANIFEVARTRFNDYGPLLRLKRYDAVRSLLESCKAVFEAERDVSAIGKVYIALAELETASGGHEEAVRFMKIALAYNYQAYAPADCAVGHSNLAIYMRQWAVKSDITTAHYLAAAIIHLQTQSGLLSNTLLALASSELPDAPPTFALLVEQVESIDGVRFQSMFECLPRLVANGDAAIAVAWQIVAAIKSGNQAQIDVSLQNLPADFRRVLKEQIAKSTRKST